jgi:hypothetical protein
MEVALRHYKWVRIFATWKYRSTEDAQSPSANLAGTIRDSSMPSRGVANLDRTLKQDSSPQGKSTFGRAPRKTLQGQGFGDKQDLGATAKRIQGSGQRDLSATLRQYPQHKMERGIPRQPKVPTLFHAPVAIIDTICFTHADALPFSSSSRRQRSGHSGWKSWASSSTRGL